MAEVNAAALAGIDALVVLQLSDVRPLAERAGALGGMPLLCVDPQILEAALQAGLRNVELRRIEIERSVPALAYTQALNAAARVDLALTELRLELWGAASTAGASAWHGWDFGPLYMLLQRAAWMRAFGRAMERAFPEAALGLLRPASPALFHLDSALSADVVAADPARWSIVGRYERALHWNALMLDAVFDFDGVRERAAAGHAGCLTHIPTCFYDAPVFAAELDRAFTHNIDLPGSYADVPLRRTGAPLLRRLGDMQFDATSRRYRERAERILADELAAWVPQRAAAQAQAAVLARRCELQAVNYLGLKRALAGTRPHVVLSSHDTGNNGPLFTLAAEWGSPVTVLPHSAYPTSVMPHAEHVTLIERDGLSVPARSMLGEPVATRGVRFRGVAEPVPRTNPKRLCLLLNAMHGDGVGHVDVFSLAALFKRLSALCAQHGWDLSVRLKPGSPALGVVSGALGMPAGWFQRTLQLSVPEVARETDLCVAYGEPTSATIAFFDAGSYLVHVSDHDWPADYVVTTPLKAALMPSWRSSELPAALAPLLADPAVYARHQQAQAAAYAARRAGAHDHVFPFTRPDLSDLSEA